MPLGLPGGGFGHTNPEPPEKVINRVPYALGWCEIEFTQDVAFEALGPIRPGRFSAPKGRRIRVEIVEDKGDQVVVQFASASCATLDKA